ncbi:GAF and ANTAR domain-containing protein [Kribbella sp. NPDC026611]|uniref:GAF and ANTAR domain-containing protein n=1 Tax=Kribbella sp. NPDC026611 TaxID=3154911 RepID=UPI0033CD7681
MDTDIMALSEELAEIGRLVEGDDVDATLARYVRRLVATVPDCDQAIIVVAGQKSSEIAASHRRGEPEPAETAEVLAAELMLPDSPMRDVLVHGEPHKIADTATDDRWPTFSAAMAGEGFRSCLLLPLPARNRNPAGFALFAAKPGVFADATYDLALLFALHAGVAFENAQLFHDSRALIDQLHTALETRTVIGQAAGILMLRYDLKSDVAFEVLKRGSQTNNLKLRELAARLVNAHEQGKLADVLRAHGLSIST